MTFESYHDFFESALLQVGIITKVISYDFIAGGCINIATRVETEKGVFFIKWNEGQPDGIFQAEAKGLELLRKTHTFQIPEVIGWGKIIERSFLVLEYIDFGVPNKNYWETFGHQLAQLHLHTQSHFGLDFDNYIGSLCQQNNYHSNWHTFYFEQRLRPQLGLAYFNGLLDKSWLNRLDNLQKVTENIFPNEKPSLLHGDLWSGNIITSPKGNPVLIDPAIYYGNREVELAFIRWLGGVPEKAWDSYNEICPIIPNFNQRLFILQLYPILVHLNLFGISYLSAINSVFSHYKT